MRTVFAESVNDDRVQLQEGTFSETGVQDGWADLVVIAQVCITHPRILSSIFTCNLGLPLVP